MIPLDTEQYLNEGCGRCELGGTPQCKVHDWRKELEALREIVVSCGLREEIKWGVPCYTHHGKNVLLLSAFRSYAAISFFKGALVDDPNRLLVKPGENSQASRMYRVEGLKHVRDHEEEIRQLILNAIDVETSGKKIEFKRNPEPMPVELEEKLTEDPSLRSAFESLTPGRQRGWIIYFASPKRSETRTARIEKSIGKILNGEGMHDKYQSRTKKKT